MIYFRPKMDSLLWERKCQITFDDVDELKRFIADQGMRFSRYIGRERYYCSNDVLLSSIRDFDLLTGWKNFCHIILDGKTIGYCGE